MPVTQCPRCTFWGTSIKRVVNHMRVHSIEPDFHVLCGIDGCAASFRRYFAYKKHVYRVHRKAAGLIDNEQAADWGSSEETEDVSIPAAPTLSEEHSHDSASNICFITKIKKQLAMSYVKITEKLKLAFSTTDEIFSILKSLIYDVIDGLMQKTVKLLMEGSVAPCTVENLPRQLNATDIPTAKPQDVLCDFTDGDAFSRYDHLTRDSSNNTIFLLLYTDELELVNPLSGATGRHKILAVYFSVLNLHPRHRSKLSSIHLLLVVEYRVVLRHGMEKVLQPLLQDLNLIQQNGVYAANRHFHVAVVAFIGDNLSMHRLAGLQCCFSRGRVCRYCLASHKQLRMLRRLDDCVERTSAAQKSHMEAFALDPAVNGPLYGITSASPLQALEKFDITEQLPPDAMHDILEGGIECVLRHVLGGLVHDRVIRKQDLERISSFKYGFHDKKATPPAVKVAFLNGKASLRGSASQKWCLFRLLPQIYAQDVPEGNSHWEVYLAYRHIVDIILAEKIPKSCVPYLQV
ncbi:hypothetical protein MTO96_034651 [Rhipicephalus appendiculatus]